MIHSLQSEHEKPTKGCRGIHENNRGHSPHHGQLESGSNLPATQTDNKSTEFKLGGGQEFSSSSLTAPFTPQVWP